MFLKKSKKEAIKICDFYSIYEFTPLVFESRGSIGPETMIFLKKLGKQMCNVTGEKKSSIFYLLHCISVGIQRTNAVLFIPRKIT